MGASDFMHACRKLTRNRDIALLLDGKPPANKAERHRSMARTTRLLRLLRAHGVIRKMPHTHRYRLTERGREIATALLTIQTLSLEQLNQLVA
jgi:hypothetical protein